MVQKTFIYLSKDLLSINFAFSGFAKSFEFGLVRHLHIVKLKLVKEGWVYLSNAIGKSPTLNHLQINLCSINH